MSIGEQHFKDESIEFSGEQSSDCSKTLCEAAYSAAKESSAEFNKKEHTEFVSLGGALCHMMANLGEMPRELEDALFRRQFRNDPDVIRQVGDGRFIIRDEGVSLRVARLSAGTFLLQDDNGPTCLFLPGGNNVSIHRDGSYDLHLPSGAKIRSSGSAATIDVAGSRLTLDSGSGLFLLRQGNTVTNLTSRKPFAPVSGTH